MSPFSRTEAFQRWLDAYGADHLHPRTHQTHALGIPLVVLSLMGFLNLIPGHRMLFGVGFGWTEVVLAAVLAFYGHHDLRIALVAAPMGAMLIVLSRMVPPLGHAAIFVLSWMLQLWGHLVWEKNRPAFFKNALQLLIGPAFFLAELLRIQRAPART